MQTFLNTIAFFIFLCCNSDMFGYVHNAIDFAHKLDKASSPKEDFFKHIHYFYEILFFVKGTVNYTVESETYRLNEGDIVVIPPGRYHFATVDLSVPYERYVLKFPESVVPDCVREKLAKDSFFYRNCKKFGGMFSQFDSYIGSYSDEELYSLFLYETGKIMIMLCHEDTTSSIGKNNEFIKKIIDYVDANITQPITMQTLADEFMYSKSFISIEFKKYMQIPIMQYVRSKKIMAAYQMILSGAKKSEVAEKFGFETYSTFYRAYKKLILATEDKSDGESSED